MNEEVNQPLTERALRSIRRQNEQPIVFSTRSLRSTGRKREENDVMKTNEQVYQPLTKSAPQSKRRQNEQPTTSSTQFLHSIHKQSIVEKINSQSDEMSPTKPHNSNKTDEVNEEINPSLTERARLKRHQNEEPAEGSLCSNRGPQSEIPMKKPKIISKNDNEVMNQPKSLIKPAKNRKSRKFVANIVTMMPTLEIYEIVWCRIRGYPTWPGVIEEHTSDGKYLNHFFGDFTRAKVTKSKIYHYLDGYVNYTKIKPSAMLVKSVTESQMFLFEENKPTKCYICEMMKLKKAIIAAYNVKKQQAK